MDSASQQDILSTLPNVLLIVIISCLPFKQCVSTSVLSKRWRPLCRQTRNISFDEDEHVSPSITDRHASLLARASFFHFMRQWVENRVQDLVLDTFEIRISNPVGFVKDIETLIEFAVYKQPKNLVIDFSGTSGRSFRPYLFVLPESVYHLTTLESLKIFACKFKPSRFRNLGLLRSFSIGWTKIGNLGRLLAKTPLLESLTIKHCWRLDDTTLAGRFREVVIEDCDFENMSCVFELPHADIFKYSGAVFSFSFDIMKSVINEVHLDFNSEKEYEYPSDSSHVAADIISGSLNDLRAARTLTVCPYVLQAIQECQNPYYFLYPVEAQHLVLRTKMHAKEFNGIRFLLHNCPKIETLTFDILPPSTIMTAKSYLGIDPATYWMQDIAFKCLRKTLKVVVVNNFGGASNEVNVLRYLIRGGGDEMGLGHGAVLDRVELYIPKELDEKQRMVARARAEMLQRSSTRVQVLVHNAYSVDNLLKICLLAATFVCSFK